MLLLVGAPLYLISLGVCIFYSRSRNADRGKPSGRGRTNRDMNSTPTPERRVELGPYVVRVAEKAGPRILGFARRGGPDLFAHLPEAVIDVPGLDRFHFLGGHRLWRAPESPGVTYQPDDAGAVVVFDGQQVDVVGLPDRDGVRKRMLLEHQGGKLIVDHELSNTGDEPVDVAPWAITQLAPGGVAYVPHSTQLADAHGVVPNRSLVLWPYTDLGAPEFGFESSFTAVAASGRPEKMKVGLSNERGWLAYLSGRELFIKWSSLHIEGAVYVDRDASVQCYRDERFLELETLGPLATLDPGDTVSHRETWASLSIGEDGVEDVLARIGPDPVTMQT